MIIAGAGGHSLEVKAELISLGFKSEDLFVYDDVIAKSDFDINYKLKSDPNQTIHSVFDKDPRFCIGVGNPQFREKLFQQLNSLGGKYHPIKSNSSRVDLLEKSDFDALAYSFIGSKVKIGKGTLINVRAHIHHECEVGEFCEISPGAILLGGVKLGDKCSIGAGAVLLPGVQLGDEVIVGAGAVVTKDFVTGCKIIGIPATQILN